MGVVFGLQVWGASFCGSGSSELYARKVSVRIGDLAKH